ncbi:MAG TPA: 3-dehydroquinate synthase [Chloroflexi bacterium]|jgi:shikimate kinase/3-dehydroquinate synthase|nr:3-dehydroquinate synthase [Chloroflexota bacterium]
MAAREPGSGATPNIVLSGFMGSGKSEVARAVAERLGRPLIDMDEVIAQRAGMSIPEIFARQGEEAFRRYERALCAELAAPAGRVIATGGGALVDAANRERMAQGGYLICLDGDPDVLVRRVGDGAGRPLLCPAGTPEGVPDDVAGRFRALWRERRAAYAALPHHIDTTARSREEVVDAVLALAAAEPISWRVRTPGGAYGVCLMAGGLEWLGDELRARGASGYADGDVVVVSDTNVWPLHGARLMAGLRRARLAPHAVVLPAGERFKTLATVSDLYDRFVDLGMDRATAVIALGGGVITDMVGFAAATYMRGVPLVPVPTTLLGMVDASVGGKVAVDHPRGKNLVGAFVEPLLVMLDPTVLDTLPAVERMAGLAEVIKAGVIADPELFAALEGRQAADLRWVVARALQVKLDVVQEDPYEQGRRMVLNLGHTFAHALEVLEDFRLHHGLAVSIGMAAAAYLGELRGTCTTETRERIVGTLRAHGLPTRYRPLQGGTGSPEAIYAAMAADKKRRGGRLRFVVPRAIGEVVVDDDVPEADVLAALGVVTGAEG